MTFFGFKVGQCDTIAIQPLLDVWHCLLDVYNKYQTDIPKHV